MDSPGAYDSVCFFSGGSNFWGGQKISFGGRKFSVFSNILKNIFPPAAGQKSMEIVGGGHFLPPVPPQIHIIGGRLPPDLTKNMLCRKILSKKITEYFKA